MDNVGDSLLPEVRRCDLAAVAMWYIWWERRQYTHGEDLQPVYRSAMSIGVLATNYWRAAKKPVERKKDNWTRPPQGIIKINVDAAFDMDQGRGSMGVIARDTCGKFMAASCKEIHFVADPFMAEAYAL